MRVWEIDPGAVDHAAIAEAGEQLRAGKLIAFPTETVYGLGANALDDSAVREIFEAKGRPADNPLIVHIADETGLKDVISNPDALSAPVKKAIAAFWPGPLTLILPVGDRVAASVHPGTDTVGVRCPNHPVANALIRAAGVPIAAPSANQSGKPSPTSARDVLEDLGDRIDGLVDGGSCQEGLESTVVKIGVHEAVIYRPGSVTKEMLEQAIAIPVREAATQAAQADGAAPSPGMKYRHYAPNAKVHVWVGDPVRTQVAMMQVIDEVGAERIAVISPRPFSGRARSWMPEEGEDYTLALSRNLYRLLRDFDRQGVSHILVQGVEREGIGAAVMNRLERAAEGRVTSV